ncbi:amino acid permease [Synechococcales cyanobacterium C]|uniref:Amino acid permease n=2 Tax=Petrachloros TaxID=2918834 RepID=A0A8K1ZZ35_9CYAN|nr:amino acid permease [Petrachloros mirabilis ULC683]
MGLGSILGTGVFVSIGLGAELAGPAVLLALGLAALVATCNGLNSAQLAANHPISGGTYEYGYRYLNPWLGFTAGWLFLLAKSASAATAALGFAGYLLSPLGIINDEVQVGVALLAVLGMTLTVYKGIRRSNTVNTVIVSLTLLALVFFISVGLFRGASTGFANLWPFFGVSDVPPLRGVLQASALMFVAYTGYGRIATLGEEVRSPQQTIPRAMIVTLSLTMAIYMGVAVAGVGSVGAEVLGMATRFQGAPLAIAAQQFGLPGGAALLTLGALTAMLGVLLNLILGLSRVLLAMGRRRDMPALVAALNQNGTTPSTAVLVMGGLVMALVTLGNIKATWSFSAFTVLIYYAITNLAALYLPDAERLYPKALAWVGLLSCLFLAFWVDVQTWGLGLVLIGVGLVWKRCHAP